MDDNQQKHPLESFMSLTMDNIKEMVDVDTVIGKPLEAPNGSMIIPLSKVKIGFASGGSEFIPKNQGSNQSETMIPFGGGSGGGVSIFPTAFLIANKEGIELISLNESTSESKADEKTPQFIEQIMEMLNKKKEDKKE